MIHYRNKFLNGKLLAEKILHGLRLEVDSCIARKPVRRKPNLVIIGIGKHSDQLLYMRNKLKTCKQMGLGCETIVFKEDISYDSVLSKIHDLNNNPEVTGLIIQLPLPPHLDQRKRSLLSNINHIKDLDSLNPLNKALTLMKQTQYTMIAPTGRAVIELLRLALIYDNNVMRYEANDVYDKESLSFLNDLKCTVLGRSSMAGLPIFRLFEEYNDSVSLIHSGTSNALELCQGSDIIVSAVGKHGVIDGNKIKENSIVIDVGINFLDGLPKGRETPTIDVTSKIERNVLSVNKAKYIVGDADLYSVIDKVKYITPVPGGVGPVTIAMLISNLIKSWKIQNSL